MGRQRRQYRSGLWNHVTNRGRGRTNVFMLARDARQYMHLLGETSDLTGVEVHAFCLMGNHFHLLLRDPDREISAFMHRVGSMYTKYLNHRVDSDGPIFRGRFYSIEVDTTEYCVTAAAYIHRNPLDIRPDQPLTAYPWSSYGMYMAGRPVPTWLRTDELLGMYGGRAQMRQFVESRAGPDVLAPRWAVDMALALHPDVEMVPHLRRTILLATRDLAAGRLAEVLDRELEFASGGARDAALKRVRKRCAADPTLRAVVADAYRLLSAR